MPAPAFLCPACSRGLSDCVCCDRPFAGAPAFLCDACAAEAAGVSTAWPDAGRNKRGRGTLTAPGPAAPLSRRPPSQATTCQPAAHSLTRLPGPVAVTAVRGRGRWLVDGLTGGGLVAVADAPH